MVSAPRLFCWKVFAASSEFERAGEENETGRRHSAYEHEWKQVLHR
jgi:hypothetical protein